MDEQRKQALQRFYAIPDDETSRALYELFAVPAGIKIARITWGYPGMWRVGVCRPPEAPRMSPTGIPVWHLSGYGEDVDARIAVQKAISSMVAAEDERFVAMAEHKKRKEAELAKMTNIDFGF